MSRQVTIPLVVTSVLVVAGTVLSILGISAGDSVFAYFVFEWINHTYETIRKVLFFLPPLKDLIIGVGAVSVVLMSYRTFKPPRGVSVTTWCLIALATYVACWLIDVPNIIHNTIDWVVSMSVKSYVYWLLTTWLGFSGTLLGILITLALLGLIAPMIAVPLLVSLTLTSIYFNYIVHGTFNTLFSAFLQYVRVALSRRPAIALFVSIPVGVATQLIPCASTIFTALIIVVSIIVLIIITMISTILAFWGVFWGIGLILSIVPSMFIVFIFNNILSSLQRYFRDLGNVDPAATSIIIPSILLGVVISGIIFAPILYATFIAWFIAIVLTVGVTVVAGIPVRIHAFRAFVNAFVALLSMYTYIHLFTLMV